MDKMNAPKPQLQDYETLASGLCDEVNRLRAANAALVTALGDLIRDHAATLAEHGIPASECGAIDNASAALARAKGSA